MRFVKYILILLIVVACDKKVRPDPPEDLLSKEEMAKILYDMVLINSAKGSSTKILQENGIDPDAYVLKKHGIDSTRFVKSNNYFAYSHKDYQEIMTLIEKRIDKEKAFYEKELEKENAEAERRKDSLKQTRPTKKPKAELKD